MKNREADDNMFLSFRLIHKHSQSQVSLACLTIIKDVKQRMDAS